jgi:putative transposase
LEVAVWRLEVSEARWLKTIEDENPELKRLLAEAMLDNAMLKDIASKNGDARCQEGRRHSSSPILAGERAAGVCVCHASQQAVRAPARPAP